MRKPFLTYLLATTLVLAITSCKDKEKKTAKNETMAQDGFVLSGTIKNVDSAMLFLEYENKEGRGIDSIPVVDGKFSFKGATEFPHMAFLGFTDSETYMEAFFVENSDITVKIDTTAMEAFVFEGSATNKEFAEFIKITETPYASKMEALYETYETLEDEAEIKALEAQMEALSIQADSATNQYIKDHPNSFIAANAVFDKFGYSPNLDEILPVYNALGDNIKSSALGEKLMKAIEIAKRTSPGVMATDLTINNTEGNPVTLSSLRGKYVFLDFWASWCGPCRAENPWVKKAYKKYKDKGFEIYAISLDVNKEAWLKAIDEDGLPWIHVSDLTNNSEAANIYGVKGIPMNFLLDKEGKIIGKNMRGEELLEAVGELF
ncbi:MULTISPECIES: TlpA disulfide reductase family protein [Flavobacteriaceae]|uniref:TlpA disulfide reductase family protein n=1 Tax=Flavobacteriaceae TaxID=49546 RepID=UPI0014909F5B|nr:MULTISPECIES: TlpA disulfide reductase family protein [Allomuricauda]MDC6367539.1 TlpA disulfide reductase family protein [Muricauda sp. AC10]